MDEKISINSHRYVVNRTCQSLKESPELTVEAFKLLFNCVFSFPAASACKLCKIVMDSTLALIYKPEVSPYMHTALWSQSATNSPPCNTYKDDWHYFRFQLIVNNDLGILQVEHKAEVEKCSQCNRQVHITKNLRILYPEFQNKRPEKMQRIKETRQGYKLCKAWTISVSTHYRQI